MIEKENTLSIPDEVVINKIYFIRGQKVMMDRDLAELYGVETKRLKEQVKRNISRFPFDFMFELSENEFEFLRSQFATSKTGRGGVRYTPMVFTEQGVAMLSSVLNSEKAIKVNIQIIRIFTKIKKAILDHTELKLAFENLKKKTDNNTKNIELVFDYLDELMKKKKNDSEISDREWIGYKADGK